MTLGALHGGYVHPRRVRGLAQPLAERRPGTRFLAFMDRVGNSRHGVALPFNYVGRQEWLAAFRTLDLTIERWVGTVRLYPRPASWVFGRGLHFSHC
jgi:hypothetical protein